MTDKVVVFDLDGTLTEEEARNVYRKLQRQTGTTVGVITSSPKRSAEQFMDEHDLDYEFIDSNLMKFFPLRGRGITYSGNPEIYVGNTVRDMVVATFSGWQFIHVSRVNDAL